MSCFSWRHSLIFHLFSAAWCLCGVLAYKLATSHLTMLCSNANTMLLTVSFMVSCQTVMSPSPAQMITCVPFLEFALAYVNKHTQFTAFSGSTVTVRYMHGQDGRLSVYAYTTTLHGWSHFWKSYLFEERLVKDKWRKPTFKVNHRHSQARNLLGRAYCTSQFVLFFL